jgi:MoaA/NifB/PqqE/SkfB family radical SAM enzyme
MEDYSNMSYILEFTELCNNRCSHCYNIWKMDGYKEKGKELTKKNGRRL